MKAYILGSCSGTEPYPGRHHTAWALEVNNRLYWFDAGEGCSHTAHTMGLDLLSVSDVFISHTHMDHIGGLANLLWTIRKLYTKNRDLPKFGDITVYIPTVESFEAVMTMLRNSEGSYKAPYDTLCKRITDAQLLHNEDVTVTAKHSLHKVATEEGYQSFSFVIDAMGKRIVFTGDISSPAELEELIAQGCDVLLCETGHHKPTEICALAKQYGVGHVYLLHHGRYIMENFDAAWDECRQIMPNVTLCNDKDVFEI